MELLNEFSATLDAILNLQNRQISFYMLHAIFDVHNHKMSPNNLDGILEYQKHKMSRNNFGPTLQFAFTKSQTESQDFSPSCHTQCWYFVINLVPCINSSVYPFAHSSIHPFIDSFTHVLLIPSFIFVLVSGRRDQIWATEWMQRAHFGRSYGSSDRVLSGVDVSGPSGLKLRYSTAVGVA